MQKLFCMETEYIPKPVKDCYHVFSDGTRLPILCDEDRDYVVMMNLIPIVALSSGVKVLALEVMSTHFHSVLRGSAKGVEKFKREIKRLIVRHFNRDGLSDRVYNSIKIEVDAIKDEEELRRKIIYVFRNCTEAGFEFLPEDYPWGPGYAYCHKRNNNYRKVSNLTYRDACKSFRTRLQLPKDWEYDEKGMLVPSSYMDLDYLRSTVFRTPRQYIAFLNVKKKDLADMEAADARPFLERKSEGQLHREAIKMSSEFFGQDIKHLSQAEKLSIATKLWTDKKTFSISQLARHTRLNVDLLRAVLHVPARE